MVELICIWCEASLRVEAQAQAGQQTCPECLSTWLYEEADGEELAVAA